MSPPLEVTDAVSASDLMPLSPVLAEVVAERAVRTGRPQFLLRSQRPYLLLGPAELRLPHLARALAWAEDQGLPVYPRLGGGSLVLLDEGCLACALAWPGRDLRRLADNFHSLAAPLFSALAELGLGAGFGASPGSFCEGRWDLLCRGRKVAGLSQAVRGRFTLVGGMLLVRTSSLYATRLVNAFYAAAGSQRRFCAAASASLEELLGRTVTVAEVAAAVTRALGPTSPVELTPAERARARSLTRARRLRPDRFEGKC